MAKRAALLNDQGEIANLQDAYGYAIDRKLWDEAAGLFSTDGTLEIGQRGVYVGRASICRSLNQQGPQGLQAGERNDHVYPAFVIAPFHFDNPVTGKPPQYPEGVRAGRAAATGEPAKAVAIRNRVELEALLAEVERDTAIAEAYDAIENLIGAFGYAQDGVAMGDGRTSFVSQILQPVIEISRDGNSAKVRARLLELQGISGGAGSWAVGVYHGTAVRRDRSWTLQRLDLDRIWSGSYPGGWAR